MFGRKSLQATQSYQQNRYTSEMSRKWRTQKSVAVDRKAARASVKRGKPQKPMDSVSLYITSIWCGTHTHSLPHPHTEVCADKQTKKRPTPFLYTISLRFARWIRIERKRTQEKGNAFLSLSLDCWNLTAFLYFTSLLTKLLSSKLAKQEL